jgi:hypothetical protein
MPRAEASAKTVRGPLFLLMAWEGFIAQLYSGFVVALKK